MERFGKASGSGNSQEAKKAGQRMRFSVFLVFTTALLVSQLGRVGNLFAALSPSPFKFIGALSGADPNVEIGKVWHPSFCTVSQVCAVGDFNGDGRDDIVAFTRGATGDVSVALSRGTEFGKAELWHDSFCFGEELPAVGDFNGDGKDDIATFTRGNSGDVYVALSDGTKFVGTGSKWHDNFCFGDEIPAVGDFNGDGWDDIVTFTRGNSGDVYVALSDGTKFVGTGSKWHDNFCFGDEIPAIGNFNGDKGANGFFPVDDIVTFKAGGKAVFVATSNGSAFVGTGDQWHSNFGAGSAVCGVGDFNGDARADIVSFEHRSEFSPVLVALSLPRDKGQIQPAALGRRACADYFPGSANPQWVSVVPSGPPVIVEGRVVESFLSSDDDPLSHSTSHDWSSQLELDSPYLSLLGVGNFGGRRGHLEVEWESQLLTDFAKTDVGDRVWMMGRWIFDCMHDNKTEIHPPQAVAVIREEPAVLPGAGPNPLPAVQARVFISGAGGYQNTGINGTDYTFEMELPRRPSPGATLAWTAFAPSHPSLPSFDFIPPEITPLPSPGNPSRLRIVIPLLSNPTTKKAVATQIVAGWNHPPSAAAVRKVRVVFDKVKIIDDHDDNTCGEWNLVVGANGHWHTVPGLGDVGHTKNPVGSCSGGTEPRIDKAFDINVLEDQTLWVRATGFEGDLWNKETPPSFHATDDALGTFERGFTIATNFGIGSHTERSSKGDYELTYRIEPRS